MLEQSRSAREISAGTKNVADQVRLITAANSRHLAELAELVAGLQETRTIAQRNGADAQLIHAALARATPAAATPAARNGRKPAERGASAH
jgi:hypothetical protein